ncbi:MAG: DUF4386 domain-containing protein [Hyphomicrobiaceae bacterium]|nr:DUF4386 domain-containing protein [Hyphomicrobiaceae bacterium]MCC0023124.1 DUF4386 domain-containing protein [Hyphomicrobiaceae bacterium]
MDKTFEPSETTCQRAVGLVIFIIAGLAIFAEMSVRATLVISGDAGATAANVIANQTLFNGAFAAYLLAYTLDVPVAVLFFRILKSAGENLSRLAMAFRLVYAAIVVAVLLNFHSGIDLLTNPAYAALDQTVRQDLALQAFNTFENGFAMSLVVFGFHLLLVGWLFFRTRQVPRWLATLVALAGVAYIVDNLLVFLAPALHEAIAPFVMVLAMSELVLGIWLLVAPGHSRMPIAQPA